LLSSIFQYRKFVFVQTQKFAEAIEIERNAFHPEWNYTIKPRRREAPS